VSIHIVPPPDDRGDLLIAGVAGTDMYLLSTWVRDLDVVYILPLAGKDRRCLWLSGDLLCLVLHLQRYEIVSENKMTGKIVLDRMVVLCQGDICVCSSAYGLRSWVLVVNSLGSSPRIQLRTVVGAEGACG